MRLEAMCEPILAGQTEDGWAVYEAGPCRYYVHGVRIPRWLFGLFARLFVR